MELETAEALPSPDGFVIQNIEMKDFMRYVGGPSELTFPKQFTVITGKTGSGKTSILDAVTFTLYKRTSRTDISGIGISDICRPGGYVRVDFAQGGDSYRVERGFTSKGSTYLNLSKNGSQIGGSIPELEVIIRETVGLDYDGFRNSTFVRQEEMKELGAESDSQRLKIFQKLFRLEIFERAQASAKNRFDDIQHEIEIGDHDIGFLREQLSKVPEIERNLSEVQVEVSKLRIHLADVEKSLLVDTERLEDLEKEHEDFISANASAEEKEKRVSQIGEEIEKVTKAGQESDELRQEIKRLEEETSDYETHVETMTQLKEKSHLATGLEKEARIHQRSIEDVEREHGRERKRLRERLNVSEGRIAALSTTVDKDEAFSLLRTEGALEERISRIEKELGWLAGRDDIIREIEDEKDHALSHIDEVNRKVQEINEDSLVLSEIEKQVDQVKKDLEGLDSKREERIKELMAAKKSADAEIKKLGFDEKARSHLAKLEDEVKEMGRKKSRLKDIRGKLEKVGDVGKLLDDLRKRLREAEKETERLRRKLKRLRSAEDSYQTTRNDVEERKKRKSEVEKDIRGKEVEIESLRNRRKELEAEEKRLERIVKELEESRSALETFAILKDQVFHKRGVAMYAINQLLPELEIETSQNLADLTDGRFTRVNLGTHEEKREYGVKIEVEGVDGDWHDVAEFSGGERTQINAALRFAIAKQLASMPQVGRTYGRMKTLFIDEGDLGSLDTESNRDLFIHKLFKMGEFFDRIVLITHLVEVADKFPGKIRVHMTPEQESRIEVVS